MKIGILGFAHGHVGIYCRRWSEAPPLGVQVIAGWDHDPARLAAAASVHGLLACPSAEALLECDVEAVVIAAETSLHAGLVELAARAGKAIVLQKPMATTLEDADRIVRAVESSGVPFTIAWQMRVDPENLVIADLLRGGRLGRVFTVRRRHGLATQKMRDFENMWHVNPEYNRDIWADDAAHPIDFIYWLFGMPQSVTAELASLLNPKVPNDNGIALFRYANGMIAEVSCSFVCLAHENSTEIVAEHGVVIQNYGDAVSIGAPHDGTAPGLKWLFDGDKQWHVAKNPGFSHQGDRIGNLAAPLADFLHGRRGPIATATEGRDVLRMVLACYPAHEHGRRVSID